MINLKGMPFCLSDEDCEWVRDTIANMSDKEKIGQLFFGISASYDEKYLTELSSKYHLGGCRYNTAPGAVIRKHNDILQRSSKIPLFIATNTESGGNNACSDAYHATIMREDAAVVAQEVEEAKKLQEEMYAEAKKKMREAKKAERKQDIEEKRKKYGQIMRLLKIVSVKTDLCGFSVSDCEVRENNYETRSSNVYR